MHTAFVLSASSSYRVQADFKAGVAWSAPRGFKTKLNIARPRSEIPFSLRTRRGFYLGRND